jgi:hypothetical protein
MYPTFRVLNLYDDKRQDLAGAAARLEAEE